jgi:uncharacterized membrane protein
VCPGWKARLLAVAFYLGLAPVLRPLGCRRDDPFVRHHAAQASMAILVLLAIFSGVLLYWALLTYLILYQRELYERLPCPEGWPVPVRDGIPQGIVLPAWLLVWAWGLVLAARGSGHALPLIGRLARRPRLLLLARVGEALLFVAVLLTTAAALHASSLTRDDDEPAPVYLLYDNMGFVPRWVWDLGFYRISLAATERWGRGSVVVAPLDEHHLRQALLHGRFVFLACHGRGGYIETSQLWVAPPSPGPVTEQTRRGVYVARREAPDGTGPWTELEVGGALQLVYNTACDGGNKAEQWEAGLAPAEVKTFARLSTTAEHIAWLWLVGPARVREIE